MQEFLEKEFSSVFGPVIEHNEFPIEDERHFTVTIRRHKFVSDSAMDFDDDPNTTPCLRCGWSKDQPFHTEEI